MIPSRATATRCAALVAQAYATNAPRPMVVREGDTLYLAFAGSRCAQDWEADACAWQVGKRWADGRLHAGFAGMSDVIAETMDATPLPDCGRIVVTGHSLGAALAVLTAYRMLHAGHPIEVVGFGCPRIGNGRWHAAYRSLAIPTLRIYRDWDPVASAPAWWGWRHVGESLHLTRGGVPISDPTTPIGKLRRLLDWHVGDADHSMPGYRGALAAMERGGYGWPA